MSEPDVSDAAWQARHELRAPVNHILSYARLVLEQADELGLDEETESRLDTILAAGHQALLLIDALLEHGEPAERQMLLALAAGTAEEAERVRELVANAGHEQATEDVGRIAEAAGRLLSLVSDAGAMNAGAMNEGAMNCAPTGSEPVGAQFIAPTPSAPIPFAPVSTAPEGNEVRPATLLVVDNDEANRDVLSRTLARLGYHVIRAEDGRVALDVLANTDVDLVLLDIMMPVLDGYAILEARRDDPRLRSIPFIVISAIGDDASVIRCIEMGAEDYLPRPFDPVLLRARIGASLERKRLREQVTRLERLSSLKPFVPPQPEDG